VYDAQLEGVDNICALEHVSQAAVLHTLRTRYLRESPLIYTRVARIMMAVNPFQSLPIYSEATMQRYMDAHDAMELEPHIFAVGHDALRGLRSSQQRNQAVLISGESGAGKTESTKLVLSFMSEALTGASGGVRGIQDKIMQINPVLESFGNAMTVRNNNSSRFGKWLQVIVSNGCAIKSCSVTDYLLELTRVCKQGPNERSYHVFFQMLAAGGDLGKDVVFMEPQQYNYIKHSQHNAPGIDDKQDFEMLRAALGALGFSGEVQHEIFRVAMGVLTLGNVEFCEEGEGCRIKDSTPARDAAGLVGVPFEDLQRSLVARRLKVGRDVTKALRRPMQAEHARDSLARLLYGRLFKFLVARINDVLSEGADMQGQYFGILDIAGFESFDVNSIEQLSINLSNEHLQSHFNNHIFKMELEDYEAEGIDSVATLTYQDNADIIALLDSRASVLSVLDEEVSVPKANDDTFHAKICRNFAQHARFIAPRFSGSRQFGVRHFAGNVTYTADHFLEKNVDTPPDEAPALCMASSLKVLEDIGGVIEQEIIEASAPGKRKTRTVSSSFRSSLASLMRTLSEAEPHFIRCIKPNQLKAAGSFQAPMVMDQLKCSGVFEAVRIRQSGFSSRIAFRDFLLRYRIVVPRMTARQIRQDLDGGRCQIDCVKDFCKALPDALSVVGKDYDPCDMALGRSKVFVRSKLVNLLDKACDLALSSYVLDVQRLWRGRCTRRRFHKIKAIFAELEEWHKSNKFYTRPGPEHTAIHKLGTPEVIAERLAALEPLLEEVRRLSVIFPGEQELQKVRRRMLNEAETVDAIAVAMVATEPLHMDRVITRCADLDIVIPQVQRLKHRLEEMKVQAPLIRAMQNALESNDREQLQEIYELVKAQNLHTQPERWLAGQDGARIAKDLLAAMNAQEAAMPQKASAVALAARIDANAAGEGTTCAVAAAAAAGEAAAREEPAETLRKEWEGKNKKRKSTITGLTAEDQSKILLECMGAMEICDMLRLEKALNEAIKQGVEEQEVISDAQDFYQNLAKEDWLAFKMREQVAVLEGNRRGDQSTSVKCLQNLIKHAGGLQVADEEVKLAKKAVQGRMRYRARKTVNGKLFEEVDMEEMGLIDEAFANLADFSGLKSPYDWRGHRSMTWFAFGNSGAEAMLVHSEARLRDSLTRVPIGLETQAVQAFHNIQGWMYDRPVPETQRASLMQEVVHTATQDKKLADEIYVQTMKQLTNNPSTRSQAQGWKLMLGLCQHVCPSPMLHEFVHVFLLKALKSQARGSEIIDSIRQCVLDLNMTATPDKVDEDLIPLRIVLIDSSVRKVLAPPSSTLQQVGEMVAKQLKIGKASDFAFFHVPEGMGHRLLPETAVLSTLLQRWKKLKARTNKSSKLLFKRRLLRVDESLRPSDLSHATLTYKQALWDYLHCPVAEDLRTILEIAVRVLHAERDHYGKDAEKNKFDSIIDQLVPEVVLRTHDRKRVAQLLGNLHAKAKAGLDPHESKLVTMSRIFSMMQELRLFGTIMWLGRQITDVPKDRISVPNAPTAVCKLSPTADAECWIAVDWFGVRFLPVDPSSGTTPLKGFLFTEEAVERMYIVGASQNVIQFVVTALDPKAPQRGRVPLAISIMSSAAVDVTYAVDVICKMKGLTKKK